MEFEIGSIFREVLQKIPIAFGLIQKLINISSTNRMKINPN
jgi:hypothetical protein